VAKDLRLRLALPRSAFSELPQEDPEPPSLPTRPRWEKHALGPIVRDLFDPSTIRPIVRRLPRGHSESPRGGLKGPTYAIEGEDLIVEYTARHLGPGVHERSSHPIDLQALMTGRHEVRWTIYADGLTKPATGVLEIQVEEPTASGMPSRALDQLPELD
jgi:hypothetical protein